MLLWMLYILYIYVFIEHDQALQSGNESITFQVVPPLKVESVHEYMKENNSR